MTAHMEGMGVMFGSQALETAIGLALLFFVLATATSAIVELVSKRLKKRHRDLEQAIGTMLAGRQVNWTGSNTLDTQFRATTIYRSAEVAAGKAGLAYLSARSFADAAVELARNAENIPAGLAVRMEQVHKDVGDDLLRFKAGLESWFDETMAVVESQYKKWATTWLFFAGFALAVIVNASAVDVARDLWNDEAIRAAVVAAADSTTNAGQDATKIEDVARTADALKELSLPIGWSEPPFDASHDAGWWFSHVVGWLVTGALLMLGAPFWFDLLSRLVSLRTTGKSPAVAPKDDASATAAVMRAEAAPSTGQTPPPATDLSSFLGSSGTAAPLPDVPQTAPSGTAIALTRRLAGELPAPGQPASGQPAPGQ